MEQFGTLPDAALRGELGAWRGKPRSTLALVIALDQLPRNLFRDTAQAFAYDATALDISRWALARNLDTELYPVEAIFLYLPLEHSENVVDQAQCVALFGALLERAPVSLLDQFSSFLSYAERHQAVIQQFGRFPHRNQILGRSSTPEEIRYLTEGGEMFDGTGSAA